MGDGSNPHHFLDMCALGELARLQELMATTRRARVAIKPFSPCGVSVKWKVHITTRHLMKAAMNAAECNGHEALLVYLREHSERLALDLKPKAPIDKIWEGGNVERIDLGSYSHTSTSIINTIPPPQAAKKILGWISGTQTEIRWLGF